MAKSGVNTWWAVAVLAGALVIAGCAEDSEDVVSLTRGKPASSKSEQRLGAEALYSCLVDAGLPAALYPVEDGDDSDAQVGWEGDHLIMARVPDQGIEINGEISMAEQEAFMTQPEDQFGLTIDGEDRTKDFQRCHEQSGYSPPEWNSDPAQEAKTRQQIAEVTNDWIACARKNGHEGLEDVAAGEAGGERWPEVILPLSTTADELRALLDACPNFDQEQAERMMDPAFASETQEWKPDPALGIEPPNMPPPGDQPPEATVPPAVADPRQEHWEELQEILYEKANAFYESQSTDY
jgi:hypothetical protein